MPESGDNKKKDAGKPQLGLIPRYAVEDFAAALEVGKRKYGAHAWRDGMEWSRLIDPLLRHAFAFAEGEDFDPTDGQPHLGSVMACAGFLSTYMRTHPELDNRPKPVLNALVQGDNAAAPYPGPMFANFMGEEPTPEERAECAEHGARCINTEPEPKYGIFYVYADADRRSTKHPDTYSSRADAEAAIISSRIGIDSLSYPPTHEVREL